MPRIWTDTAVALLVLIVLGGCATSKDKLLPHGEKTMLDVWSQETGGGVVSGRVVPRLPGTCSMRARACAGP